MKATVFLSDNAYTTHQTKIAVPSMESVFPKECKHFQKLFDIGTESHFSPRKSDFFSHSEILHHDRNKYCL